MRSAIKVVMLTWFLPTAAQSQQPNAVTVNCNSNLQYQAMFCREYRDQQDRAWDRRDKLPGDQAEVSVRLGKFRKNEVTVVVTATLSGIRYSVPITGIIDPKHARTSAAMITAAVSAVLDGWAKKRRYE